MTGTVQRPANPLRGEVELVLPGLSLRLRPSFAALVAAEAEVGGLAAAIERAAAGDIRFADVAGLFWHCAIDDPRRPDRSALEQALVRAGLGRVTPAYRTLLLRIYSGE